MIENVSISSHSFECLALSCIASISDKHEWRCLGVSRKETSVLLLDRDTVLHRSYCIDPTA